MNRRIVLIILVIAAAAVLAVYSSKIRSSISNPFIPRDTVVIPKSGISIFVARICASCHEVDHYVVANGLDKKDVALKDIETDKASETLFYKIAARCNLSPITPLLWDGKMCTAGEPKVLEYLKRLK